METFLLNFIRHRRLVAEAISGAIACAAIAASFLLRFEFAVPPAYLLMLGRAILAALAVKAVVYRAFGLRHLAWRYVGFEGLLRIAAANAVGSLALTIILSIAFGPAFPRSIYVLDFMLCILLEMATRAGIRVLLEAPKPPTRSDRKRALIFGAGQAGMLLLNELRTHPEMGFEIAGFLDDDPAKRGMRVHGLRILGNRADIPHTVEKLSIHEILIALPQASGNDITEILERCHEARVPAKRVPALSEIIEHRVLAQQIREVRIEDLLGRPAARLDTSEGRNRIAGQAVLVTGAGGSIGGELCRQIASHQPALLVGFDHSETALFEIEQELRAVFPNLRFCAEIGSVQKRYRLDEVFALHRPASVYHAAAYKHVPMMEAHIFEAIKNNVFGTRNVARAAAAWGARDFVLISTDKAVRPANIMGATKRLAELVCLLESGKLSRLPGAATKIVVVRFGNVLGSNGSVIPQFRKQIAKGGPVTVTHPDMRRFFMTIPEAAQLVLQAGAMGAGGEIFVLEMGEPVRILDLARKLILLSGLRPELDVPITFSGLRPGEKMYEELSAYEENTVATPHRQIRVFTGAPPDRVTLERALDQLRTAVRARDAADAVMILKDLIPDYSPSSSVLHAAFRARAA
jgi:FlaA1/EpsC-like NDP-sugar epimerase